MRDLNITARGNDGDAVIAADVDFTVRPGEAVAIVGESGSGKSLTARALMRLLPDGVHAVGDMHYGDRDLMALGSRARRRLRGREMAFIMQDPFTMLNPTERCGNQITQPLRDDRGQRLGRKARRAEAERRLREVGIPEPSVAERYPFELSGGMRQRVGIAAAIAENPGFLIADEPTTALDVTTQQEILELLGSLRKTHDMGLILITHDLRVAFSVCDRVHVMYAGSLVETAPAQTMAEAPRHPYTLGLLLADPPIERRVEALVDIPGGVPRPGRRPPGCPFAPRCDWAEEACTTAVPEIREVAPGHTTRCRRIDEISAEFGSLRQQRQFTASAPLSPAKDDSDDLIVVENLRKVFPGSGRHSRDVVALDGVSIRAAPGERVGLVGESGSGKTTLARTVIGLERPSSGRIVVGGVELPAGRALRGEDAEMVRSTLQMVFQDPYSSLNPALSVRSTLLEALDLGGEGRRTENNVEELLARVGLPASYASRRSAALSGGERQRVSIARALARRPRLLVCDEVVSALDVSVQAQILNLLRDLGDELGLAYLFIAHDLAVVRQITDRLYVLRGGVVVEEGATEAILDNPQHPYTQNLIASIPGSRGSQHAEVSRPEPSSSVTEK